MQDAFFFTKEAIDTYFKGRPFAITVVGAVAWGRSAASRPRAKRAIAATEKATAALPRFARERRIGVVRSPYAG